MKLDGVGEFLESSCGLFGGGVHAWLLLVRLTVGSLMSDSSLR